MKNITLTILFLTLFAGSLSAQSFNHLSLDVGIGNVSGNSSGVLGVMGGDLDVASRFPNPTVHARLGYSFSPVFTARVGLEFIYMTAAAGDSFDRTFRTDGLNLSLRGDLMLAPLLNIGGVNWSPHLHAGLGGTFAAVSQVRNIDGIYVNDTTESIGNYFFGLGITRRINDLVDIYTEYNHQLFMASTIEGAAGSTDRLGYATLGVRFKLGKSGQQHMAWNRPVQPAPQSATASRLASAERQIDTCCEEANQLRVENSSLKSELDRSRNENAALRERNDRLSAEINDLRAGMGTMQAEVDRLRRELDTIASRPPVPAVQENVSVVPGVYVQVFAGVLTADTDLAESMLRQALEGERQLISQIKTIEHRNFKKVVVGPFQDQAEARRVLGMVRSAFPDAFIADIR